MTLKYHPGPDEPRRAKRVGHANRWRGARQIGGMVIAVAAVAAIVALPITGGALAWKHYLIAFAGVGVLALVLGVAARRHLDSKNARGGERCKLCGQPLDAKAPSRGSVGCPECGT